MNSIVKLPATKRMVYEAEHVHCAGQSKREKREFLKHRYKVRMSNTAWDRNLLLARAQRAPMAA